MKAVCSYTWSRMLEKAHSGWKSQDRHEYLGDGLTLSTRLVFFEPWK